MSKNQTPSVVVVGSGNVAEAVARGVAESWSLELKQIVARNERRAAEIATLTNTEFTTSFDEAAEADIYIVAVSDRAVAEVAAQIQRPADSIMVHTAGSVEMDALGEGLRGVLYPFQTFTAGRRVEFADVPLFIEGCNLDVEQRIEEVAHALSGKVYHATSLRRREIHLSGVLACNFVNSLYSMAADRLQQRESLPFDVLRPLILETARKAAEAKHPRNVQTGPAVRGDRAVAERHMEMLDDEQREIYNLLNDYIWQTSRKI